LNYINIEQKNNSDVRAQTINSIDKALLPVVEEKKNKQMVPKRKNGREKKKKDSKDKGSIIDYEG
jgi:hypothetical protein